MKLSWLQMVLLIHLTLVMPNFVNFNVYKNKSGSGIFKCLTSFCFAWLSCILFSDQRSDNVLVLVLISLWIFLPTLRCLSLNVLGVEIDLLKRRPFYWLFAPLFSSLSWARGWVFHTVLFPETSSTGTPGMEKNSFAVCRLLQLVLSRSSLLFSCLLLELLAWYFGSCIGFVYYAKYSSCWCF